MASPPATAPAPTTPPPAISGPKLPEPSVDAGSKPVAAPVAPAAGEESSKPVPEPKPAVKPPPVVESRPEPAPKKEAPVSAATARLDWIKFLIALTLFVSFPILLGFLLHALNFLFGVIQGQGTQSKPANVDLSTAEKMALAASVQVAIAMVMGFVSVFMGLMMTWFGINAAFELTGKSGDKGEASLKSASPGLLFFLGGIILIGVSLYKKIEYQEPGHATKIPLDGNPGGASPGTIPPKPPSLDRAEKPA